MCVALSNAHRFVVWSNFEIANMEFWRSEAYSKFFDHLESKGGFYYEVCLCLACTAPRSSCPLAPRLLRRHAPSYTATPPSFILSIPQAPRAAADTRPQRWGDAPVHSIAAGLLQSKDKLHFFDDIGYEHSPFTHCPHGDGAWARGILADDASVLL